MHGTPGSLSIGLFLFLKIAEKLGIVEEKKDVQLGSDMKRPIPVRRWHMRRAIF